MPENQDESSGIVYSPFKEVAKNLVVPDVSLPTFVFRSIKLNEKILGDKPVLIDAVSGQVILFKEVEPLARRFASALARIGFQKGDVLYYMTYNAALLYVLNFGVWLCGGAIRGCYQKEEKEEIERQMKETKCRFVLCESETAPVVKWITERLGWPVKLLSIDGEVEGAMAVEDMVYKDDGCGMTEEVQINAKEDIVCIPSTNGSTGLPKGTLHTHHNIVGLLAEIGAPLDLEKFPSSLSTILSVMGNFNVGPFLSFHIAVIFGHTFISISKFDVTSFFKYIEKYKPNVIFLFPYLANWFARCQELDKLDLSCVKEITCGGSVVDKAVLTILNERLPEVKISVLYGMTETLLVSSVSFGQYFLPGKSCKLKVQQIEDEHYVSCGPLLPFVEGKIVDIETGKVLGRKSKGKLLVRTPLVMKGYLKGPEGKGYASGVDEDGWLDTGDVGFFDEEGHLYIIDRLKSIFKYHMHQVSPAEIERVIGEHPSVLSVGVVGVPDPNTTSVARAYVIVKPGHSVTEDAIKKHVEERTVSYKHLHGGVVFVDKLPQTRGGKLDRTTLLKRAIQEMKSSSNQR